MESKIYFDANKIEVLGVVSQYIYLKGYEGDNICILKFSETLFKCFIEEFIYKKAILCALYKIFDAGELIVTISEFDTIDGTITIYEDIIEHICNVYDIRKYSFDIAI